MRSMWLAPLLLLAGCWRVQLPELPQDQRAFDPAVGAPADWWVFSFETTLTCPGGEPARFHLLYPGFADRREVEDAPAIPIALVFHSGAFDYVASPTAGDPTAGASFQTTYGNDKRLTLDWSAERIFASLGLYPNYDRSELHAGTLPAALATINVATLWPGNCWGDIWHNRTSLAQNNYEGVLFFRDGRTAAEFAYLHATTSFPPGNPVELPIRVDTERVFAVGLGDGVRAVSELLALRDDSGPNVVFPYTFAAAVLDSPIDDLTVYADASTDEFQAIHAGLNRIFPDGGRNLAAPSAIPPRNLPDRLGILVSANDTRIPLGANDALLATDDPGSTGRFGPSSGVIAAPGRDNAGDTRSVGVWIHRNVEPRHVLSNADVDLAKAVADFFSGGLDEVDPQLAD